MSSSLAMVRPNVAVQALVRVHSEAEREARVACNRVLGKLSYRNVAPFQVSGPVFRARRFCVSVDQQEEFFKRNPRECFRTLVTQELFVVVDSISNMSVAARIETDRFVIAETQLVCENNGLGEKMVPPHLAKYIGLQRIATSWSVQQ
jgi:hypothetical protein